jgi:hypothetical protein
MTERRIEPLDFNGETIYVEVTEIDKSGETSTGGFEKTSTGSNLSAAGEQVRSTISALAATVGEALEKAPPTEWSLEINIGFKGKAGIPFITESAISLSERSV